MLRTSSIEVKVMRSSRDDESGDGGSYDPPKVYKACKEEKKVNKRSELRIVRSLSLSPHLRYTLDLHYIGEQRGRIHANIDEETRNFKGRNTETDGSLCHATQEQVRKQTKTHLLKTTFQRGCETFYGTPTTEWRATRSSSTRTRSHWGSTRSSTNGGPARTR